VCQNCYVTAQFSDETQSMLSPHSGGLNGEWEKSTSETMSVYFRVFFLQPPSLTTPPGYCRLASQQYPVHGRKTQRMCPDRYSIPGETPTPLPRHLRHAIRLYIYIYIYTYIYSGQISSVEPQRRVAEIT